MIPCAVQHGCPNCWSVRCLLENSRRSPRANASSTDVRPECSGGSKAITSFGLRNTVPSDDCRIYQNEHDHEISHTLALWRFGRFLTRIGPPRNLESAAMLVLSHSAATNYTPGQEAASQASRREGETYGLKRLLSNNVFRLLDCVLRCVLTMSEGASCQAYAIFHRITDDKWNLMGTAKSALYCCRLFQCFRSHTLCPLVANCSRTARELQ